MFSVLHKQRLYTENSILYHNYANNSKQVVTTSKGLFEESTTPARIRASFPNTERRCRRVGGAGDSGGVANHFYSESAVLCLLYAIYGKGVCVCVSECLIYNIYINVQYCLHVLNQSKRWVYDVYTDNT